MSFGATPLDGSATPLPMSTAVPDGSNQPYVIEGGPTISTGGNTLVPVSMWIKDGNNVVEGTTTDAANANTIIGQLKQIQANTSSQPAGTSASATLQNAASANGNGTSLTTLGHATVAFTVSSTFSATVNFEGTEDNSNWVAIETLAFNSTTPVTTTTGAGSFVASCAGMQSVRARVSGYASGSITVTAHAVPVSFTSLVSGGGGSGGTSSSFGSAFPGTGTAVGASDGTNMQGLQVESSSNKNLRVALYNGATEASVTGANALKVDGSAVTQPVSGTVTANAGTGTFTNQQSNNTADYDTGAGTQTMTMFGLALPASGGSVAGGTATNPVQVSVANTGANSTAIKVDNSAVTQPVSGTVTVQQSTASNLKVDLSGTAANGTAIKVDGSAVTQPVTPQATTTGGSTLSHTMSAATTNATSLKASAGMVYGFCISNTNASARYFKLYNKASAPTVGTDTPVTTVQVPANGTVIRVYPVGAAFGTGIAWAATTGIANSDTGAVGANDLSIDIDYK